MRPQGTDSAVQRKRRTTVRITAALAVLLGLAGLVFAAASLRSSGDAGSPRPTSHENAARPPDPLAQADDLDSPTRLAASTLTLPGLPTSMRDDAPTPAAQNECPLYPILEPAEESGHAFYFTRGAYNSGGSYWGRRRRSSWATDFEKADRQFLVLLRELIDIDAFPCENPVRLDDPELRRFPFLYMVEVGYLGLTEPEIEGLRNYLLAGGFLLVDDFWGNAEWANFERYIRRVLPEYPISDVPPDHPIFRVAYNIDEVLQVPSIQNAQWGVYYEREDAKVPYVRGIFDDNGRLLVGIVWNSDLGDAWEWAEQPDYPWDRANFAIKMGVNFIVYAMTH